MSSAAVDNPLAYIKPSTALGGGGEGSYESTNNGGIYYDPRKLPPSLLLIFPFFSLSIYIFFFLIDATFIMHTIKRVRVSLPL